MTHSKAAGILVKNRDPEILVLRVGDFQEGKDERKLHCIHCWAALRSVGTKMEIPFLLPLKSGSEFISKPTFL